MPPAVPSRKHQSKKSYVPVQVPGDVSDEPLASLSGVRPGGYGLLEV